MNIYVFCFIHSDCCGTQKKSAPDPVSHQDRILKIVFHQSDEISASAASGKHYTGTKQAEGTIIKTFSGMILRRSDEFLFFQLI